jgi:hypothetical protein
MNIIWLIVAVGFVAPLLILAGLFVVNRFTKGDTGKTINLLWLLLAVMLVGFLGYGIFGRAQ